MRELDCEKAECGRIDAFELWCWRRLLRVPWTARISNLSILKDWNSNTLAISCEELTHWKRPWCWERLWAGGEGDDIGWDGWMASPTQQTWVWVDSGNWWQTKRPGVLWFMGLQRVGHDWATELNWTEHCTGGSNQNHPQVKEMQKDKMVVWGGFINSWEKKRYKRQGRKGNIHPTECKVPENRKEIRRPS